MTAELVLFSKIRSFLDTTTDFLIKKESRRALLRLSNVSLCGKMASIAEMLHGQIRICALANVRPSGDGSSFDVYPAHGGGPSFTVKTLHISCKSDTYRRREHKYGGIIIYARNNETDWYTSNRTHCKSGYVVIMRTDTEEFQEKQNKWRGERGRVHGTIYRIAFGESCDDVTIIGEGFGIIGGKFKTTSGAFNPAHGDDYHDDTVSMHPDSARYVKALVDIWKRAGPHFPGKQNYSVKELGD